MFYRRLRIGAAALTLLIPVAASAQSVVSRERNQQERIGQGIASGQITGGGAHSLERREASINRTRRADRAADGGHLTHKEDRALNNRENALSHTIYQDKHNDVAQPSVTPR